MDAKTLAGTEGYSRNCLIRLELLLMETHSNCYTEEAGGEVRGNTNISDVTSAFSEPQTLWRKCGVCAHASPSPSLRGTPEEG